MEEREERGDELGVGVLAAGLEAEAVEDRGGHLALEGGPELVERGLELFLAAERHEAFGEAGEVPGEDVGLAAEGVEAVLVEIGGGEGRVVGRQEPPRAVVEALAGDVDVVGVEDAVDEARGDPARAGAGDALARPTP